MPACLQIRKPASYPPTRPSLVPLLTVLLLLLLLSRPPHFRLLAYFFRVFCLSPNSLVVSPLSKNTEPRYRPIIFPLSSPPYASRGLQGKSIAVNSITPPRTPRFPRPFSKLDRLRASPKKRSQIRPTGKRLQTASTGGVRNISGREVEGAQEEEKRKGKRPVAPRSPQSFSQLSLSLSISHAFYTTYW